MQYAFLSQTICPRSAMRPLQGSEVENAKVKITTLIRTSIHALINALLQIRAQALGQYIKQAPFSNNWLPSSSYFLK